MNLIPEVAERLGVKPYELFHMMTKNEEPLMDICRFTDRKLEYLREYRNGKPVWEDAPNNLAGLLRGEFLIKTNPTEGEVVQESMANITDFARLISECSMGYDNRESEAKRRAKAACIRKHAERILNLINGVEKALDGDTVGKGKKK